MFNEKKITAIIVAAGRGNRFGGDLPKQFLNIGGMTVLEKAVLHFENHPAVDEMIVAAPEDYMEQCRRICGRFSKMKAAVRGGRTRQESVMACLEDVSDGLVLVHDAARPFVTAVYGGGAEGVALLWLPLHTRTECPPFYRMGAQCQGRVPGGRL